MRQPNWRLFVRRQQSHMIARVKKAKCPAARAVDKKEVLGWATNWVRALAPYAENPCAFFDIDHTLVDGRGKPLEDALKLVRTCEQHGVHCFYITARPESGRTETLQLLHSLKLRVDSQDLAMHPPRYPPPSNRSVG